MTSEQLTRTILDLLTEDSYAASEIVAKISEVDPTLTPADAREITKRSITQLIQDGCVAARWLADPGGPEDNLSERQAASAIADDLSWMTYKVWRPHLRFVATQRGDQMRQLLR